MTEYKGRKFKLNNIKCEPIRERGRIFIKTNDIKKGLIVLKKVFGITSFSPSIKTKSNINNMISYAIDISKKMLNKDKSFALRVNRVGDHTFSSQDVAIKIGNKIVDETKARVDLNNPDFELFIDIRFDDVYFFTKKIIGLGGLPYGTQGNILALINDTKSILAAWYLMRRGCNIIFLNTKNQTIKPLNSFSLHWYLKPDIINLSITDNNIYETINKIANEKSCYAIVTGHSLNKDSMKIISDIKKINQQINYPILHPLISMNQDEINKKCEKVGIKI